MASKRVFIREKDNIVSSNRAKKKKINTVVDPKASKIHGKPRTRVMRTSIQAIKQEEKTNTQNKRIWLNKTTNATANGTKNKLRKASSFNLIKNT